MQRALVLAAVAAAMLEAQPRVPEGARVTRDVVYANAGSKDLLLDLYVPAGDSKRPLVVWIHGGAWRSGNKSNPPALFLVERGFAVASISYRLTHEAVFPAQIHDCKAAIRWLRAHSAQYGYDAAKIGVWGSSAGGHLVALLGTSGGVAELEGPHGTAGESSRVQAVVDFYGPTDLPAMSKFPSKMDHNAADSPESLLVGGPIQQNREKAAVANPIRYVSKDDPPFFIVHGDQDPLVPMNQSELLHEALKAAGVRVEYEVIAGGGHGGPQFNAPEMRDRIAAFFGKHLR